jgi:signal recognition particle GTPase
MRDTEPRARPIAKLPVLAASERPPLSPPSASAPRIASLNSSPPISHKEAARMSDEWKNDDWKKSLPQLRQARSDAQRAIENLAKASEALQLYMVVNESAQTNLARQEYLESIEKRLVKARYEITEIDRLIEQLEKAGSE